MYEYLLLIGENVIYLIYSENSNSEQLASSMKPERCVWSLLFTMKGPVLVETMSKIMAVNIK